MTMIRTVLSRHAAVGSALLCAVLACMQAQAADTQPEPAKAAPAAQASPLAQARKLIESKRWDAALQELRRVDARGDADWNNLMGFALRKQARPDLEGAQRHYDTALRIDPRHQGAHEYAGELALMKGDLAGAERHRTALAALCTRPCEALDDLSQAIARFKATGKI